MRKTITIVALAGVMMLLAIPTAFANSEHSNDSAGYGTKVCRPGADNGLIGSWTPKIMTEYIDDILDRVDPDRTDDDLYLRIVASATATWDFCDKNLDGILCVMTTDPSPYYWTLLDNRPFPG
jgi:hypothetical protein